MSDRHDDRQPLAPDDEAFVRSVADLYAAPPMTASQRTRFDARLEERIRDGAARRRPWFAVVAVAAAVVSLLVWRAGLDVPDGGEVAPVAESKRAVDESEIGAEDWLLAMETGSLPETDEALPADYLAISDLLLGD
jgi:hypothetical protein